jgi:hypothetical protein
LCTGDISNPKKLKYNLAYYTKLADELIVNGAHVLCIKVGEQRVCQWSQDIASGTIMYNCQEQRFGLF